MRCNVVYFAFAKIYYCTVSIALKNHYSVYLKFGLYTVALWKIGANGTVEEFHGFSNGAVYGI